MKTARAIRTHFTIGDTTLDGYQMPNGDYKMSRKGLLALDILGGNSTGKKYAQPILDADNPQGELTKIEGNNASAKLISLEAFSAIVTEYAKLGNKKCQAIVFACFAESIERRLDSAFGKSRSEQERNQRFIDRQNHREDYHPKFTAWHKLDGCEGVEYALRVNELKKVLGLPIDPIGEYNSAQLRKLDIAYIKYDTLRTAGMKHDEAMSVF